MLQSFNSPLSRLIFTGIIVVLGGSFHFGYQLSIINSLESFIKDLFINSYKEGNINEIKYWGVIVSLLYAGALVGAILVPFLLTKFGTKCSFYISSMFLSGSFALAAVSKLYRSPNLFVFSRLLSGIGVGQINTIQSIYLTEISPIKYRGLMGTLTGFSTSIGFVVALGLGLKEVFGTEDLWHWTYLIEIFPVFVFVIALFFFFPESPTYSVQQGNENEILRSISLYYEPNELSTRKADLLREHSLQSIKFDNFDQQKNSYSRYLKIFKTKNTRNALIICVLLNGTVGFSGIVAITSFGKEILENVGFGESALLAEFCASIFGLFGNLVSSITIEKIGRRKLLINGLGILAVLNFFFMILSILFELNKLKLYGYIFLAVKMLFFFVFSSGIGPMAWFIATELSTSLYCSQMQSMSVFCQYFTCLLATTFFYNIYSRIRNISFFLFIVPLSFTSIYLYFKLPETKNRSIEQIISDLSNNNNFNKKKKQKLSNNFKKKYFY